MKAMSCATVIAMISGGLVSTATATGVEDAVNGIRVPDPIGHIYFNMITGERIATLLSDGVRPASGEEGSEVWIADNDSACADIGDVAATAVILDDPNGDFGDPVEGDILLDWGDIAADTVVDCVQLSFFSGIEDVDSDSDSIGDGVDGFAASWGFFEADNGFDSCFTRQGLVGLTLFGLPGQLDGPGQVSGFLFTLDLASSFASSLAFEIGDTDSDPQSAAVHNPMINADADSNGFGDADLDSDGLADMSYTISYTQPGRIDVDNADGDSDSATGIDGDPGAADITVVGLASIRVPSLNGAEAGWDIIGSDGLYDGTFGFTDFTCQDGSEDTYNFGQADIIMYGPSESNDCVADYAEPFGELDIFDVLGFIEAFNASDSSADLADPTGVFDIFDVLAFVDAFNTGCP